MRPTCKNMISKSGCYAAERSYSWCRAVQRIWWILWEAPAPRAAPGRQRRRAMPPRCCTSPPLCSALHGTAEHPPCASDLTTRQKRHDVNITQAEQARAAERPHTQTQLKHSTLKVNANKQAFNPKVTYIWTCLHTALLIYKPPAQTTQQLSCWQNTSTLDFSLH